ncbi:MAG TPA: DNA alkylation repair protein [Saprospiraceae bacterium]|nr:DNA alkylation repair protein [Saprospiraceae bacterium]HRK80192.1 DNA alkylation repair protein [Saprospiraceae bacterium]
MQSYLEHVKRIFLEHGDPDISEGQMKYMRHQFAFYGLKAPVWMALAKDIFQTKGIPQGEELKTLVRLCFEEEYRELHYFATEMTQRALKKQAENFIDFLEELITSKSWWDTVDWQAKLAGEHFLRYPQLIGPITERWMQSGNFWLQRCALIFQLRYKTRTDAELMFGYVLRLADSKEFFIQKGAGWALREYSKTNPEAVRSFVESHSLAPLTRREALKWLQNKS